MTNVNVTKRTLNSPSIIDIISARHLFWIGRIAKMNLDQVPRKFFACWNKYERKPVGPKGNMRISYATSIVKVFPYILIDLALELCIPFAEQKSWQNIVKKLD